MRATIESIRHIAIWRNPRFHSTAVRTPRCLKNGSIEVVLQYRAGAFRNIQFAAVSSFPSTAKVISKADGVGAQTCIKINLFRLADESFCLTTKSKTNEPNRLPNSTILRALSMGQAF